MTSVLDPPASREEDPTDGRDLRQAVRPARGSSARWVRMLGPAAYDRLDAHIRIAEAEIARRAPAAQATHAGTGREVLAALPTSEWAATATALLRQARSSLEAGRIDEGWRLLHAARRMEVVSFGPDEVDAYVTALTAESDKLGSWRQKCVRALLVRQAAATDGPHTAAGAHGIRVAHARQAAAILDEHYHNQAYKARVARAQVLVLAAILALTLVAILSLSYLQNLPLSGAPDRPQFFLLLSVALFGVLGGTISAMLRASDMSSSARIPEVISAIRVTFMRILMGGASAVVVLLAVRSQLNPAAETLGALTPETTYVIAIAAGFGERLVLRAIEQVVGKQGTTAAEKAV